jgi:hypothetical protein
MLHSAGARPTRNTLLFFGGCAGDGHFSDLVQNVVGILNGARQALLEQDLASAEGFDAAVSTLARWSERPDAAIWYGVCYAEGVRV